MQSRSESERRTQLIITDRPDSSQMVDLHVYIIPKKVWKNHQNLVENVAIDQAISAGFVRISENLTIHDLRRYILDTCGDDDDFPKEFLYLRSVGRCLAKVKQQQEKELKVKNFRPPTTLASEIYILEENHDDNFSASTRKHDDLLRESPISSQHWIKPAQGPPFPYPLFNHNLFSFSTKLSPRDLAKSRQEQERLYLRQIELARQRHEIENQYHKEEEAAIKIQTAFRNYRDRQNSKQREADAIEFERLQKLNGQKARVRFSNRLEELQAKRIELQTNRELIVRQMQQLHTRINNQRKEEKDLWKKKYFIEKNQITTYEEQNHILTKNSSDIHNQLEQAKISLNNATKLRQQAEYESRILRQELQQISSSLNALDRYRLPKQPVSLDIILQY